MTSQPRVLERGEASWINRGVASCCRTHTGTRRSRKRAPKSNIIFQTMWICRLLLRGSVSAIHEIIFSESLGTNSCATAQKMAKTLNVHKVIALKQKNCRRWFSSLLFVLRQRTLWWFLRNRNRYAASLNWGIKISHKHQIWSALALTKGERFLWFGFFFQLDENDRSMT